MAHDDFWRTFGALEQLLEAARPPELAYYGRVVRLEASPAEWVLQVVTIRWDTSHESSEHWSEVRRWSLAPTETEFEAAVRELYASPEYFGSCQFCQQEDREWRYLRGNMYWDGKACHGCASRHYGVLY